MVKATMAASRTGFEMIRLSLIDDDTKNTVFGYIRNVQSLFPSNNIYYNIPLVIQHLCACYYYVGFRFYKKKYGDGLQFYNQYKSVKKNDSYGYSTCIFGQAITNEDCNEFKIFIKLNNYGSFQMGYITANIDNSIKDFNVELGTHENEQNSVGIQTWNNEQFRLYDKYNYLGKY